jgi:hypothetical protein
LSGFAAEDVYRKFETTVDLPLVSVFLFAVSYGFFVLLDSWLCSELILAEFLGLVMLACVDEIIREVSTKFEAEGLKTESALECISSFKVELVEIC